MFYESERIVRKNRKYVKSRACGIVQQGLNKGLTYEEIVFANDMMLKNDDILNETQIDIVKMARQIAQTEMEKENEESTTRSADNNSTDVVQSRTS